jgi:HK97 family phage portal protein
VTYGELAAQVQAMRDGPRAEGYLGGVNLSLEQITSDVIAWHESNMSADFMSIPAVYACVRLIASTIDQLPLVSDFPDDWLQRPRRYGSALDLGDLVQWVVTSMATRGSADLFATRVGDSWRLDALHPESVQVRTSTYGPLTIEYLVGGSTIPPVPAFQEEWRGGPYILHIPYVVTPQRPAGSSPLVDAREALAGYAKVERQAANLLDNGTYSGGRLETDQDITTATAERYQERWIANRNEGRLPVLGAGLRYVNDLINPTDAQWLESRLHNAQSVAQMFGVPPDYLGMAMSGGSSSLSYANAQDNDRRFRRNCLNHFTSQIEDALSQLAPQGRSAAEAGTVRFDYTGWEATGDGTDQPEV